MTEVEQYLNELKDLREQRDELASLVKIQRREVAVKLHSIYEDLNQGPLPLLPLHEDALVAIDDNPKYGDPEYVWEVHDMVYFVNQDPSTTGYDFGSSFDLYITNKEIEINHGCIGQWGLKDKGQWSRLLLMRNIFLHEDDIIRELKQIINAEIIKELHKVQSKIMALNDKLQSIERKEFEEKTIKALKETKYLARKAYNWFYQTKEDGSIDYNAPMIKKYWWDDAFKIEKITDKSIIGYECDGKGRRYNYSRTNRLKLDEVINDIQFAHLYLVNDLTTSPQPDGDSK